MLLVRIFVSSSSESSGESGSPLSSTKSLLVLAKGGPEVEVLRFPDRVLGDMMIRN